MRSCAPWIFPQSPREEGEIGQLSTNELARFKIADELLSVVE